MICAFCKNEIDGDSFFCDQCGKEIKVCPQCGAPGKGKVCTEHGKKLVPARENQGQNEITSQPSGKPEINNVNPELESPGLAAVRDVKTEKVLEHNAIPQLNLVNNSVNLDLAINNGDIIGRRKGRFADKFGQYKQISGSHAKFDYSASGWRITDLDSSNGTKYNGQPLQANTPVTITDNSRIILANIEFIVKIDTDGQDDNEKTMRI